jgi:ADP-ribose pyrophosphatase YjhB (NUDIX family)
VPTDAPRVGVGALIIDDEGRVLLVHRRRMPEADHWGLPGGKVDFGETIAATCAREILEELGVVIAVGDLACVVDQIDLAGGTHWVAPVFHARIVEGEPANQEPEAISEIGWFAPDALPAPLTLSAGRALDL